MESSNGFPDRVFMRNVMIAFDAVRSRCISLYDVPSSFRPSVVRRVLKATSTVERASASTAVEAGIGRSVAQIKTVIFPIAHRNSA